MANRVLIVGWDGADWDVLDPLLFRDEVVRGFLHVFTSFLNVWRHSDFGASLDRMLARTGEVAA